MAPTARRRNPRGQGAGLGEEIVAAALRLVDARQSLTLRAVAREAGIAAPSIYAHFKDVEQVAAAVIARCFDELAQRVEAVTGDDPVARLHAAVEAYLDYAEEQPGRYFLLFRFDRPDGAAIYTDEYVASGNAALETLVSAITDCVEAGRSASIDATRDAVAVWAAIHGLASLRTSLNRFPWPERQELTADMVDRLARVV
jgi:AcrR family transcriptional regulator